MRMQCQQMFTHLGNKISFYYIKGIIEHNKYGYKSETQNRRWLLLHFFSQLVVISTFIVEFVLDSRNGLF